MAIRDHILPYGYGYMVYGHMVYCVWLESLVVINEVVASSTGTYLDFSRLTGLDWTDL
jgi:hypothetical protein